MRRLPFDVRLGVKAQINLRTSNPGKWQAADALRGPPTREKKGDQWETSKLLPKSNSSK
jgi:hypothetical protein